MFILQKIGQGLFPHLKFVGNLPLVLLFRQVWNLYAIILMTAEQILIDEEQAVFLQKGVSITVGSCNAEKMPSVGRAMACKLSADRIQVTLYLSAAQAASVLRDVESNGMIAAVFSEPSTHRTIQLKGRNAAVNRQIDKSGIQAVSKHLKHFSHELLQMGFPKEFTYSLLGCPESDIVSVTFQPSAAFSQTPGPNAGSSLRQGA